MTEAVVSVVRGWGTPEAPGTRRLSLGIGRYALGARDNYSSSTTAVGVQLGAEATATVRHVGLTLGVHPTLLPNVRGGSAWWVPLGVGLRFW